MRSLFFLSFRLSWVGQEKPGIVALGIGSTLLKGMYLSLVRAASILGPRQKQRLYPTSFQFGYFGMVTTV